MRGKLLLLAVGVACMWAGGQKAYVGATNRQPTKVSVADFAAGKCSAVWVELTDGRVDYEHSITLESRVLKVDKGTFVPLVPVAGGGGLPAVLLEMKTSQVETRAAQSMARLGSAANPHGETITGMQEWGILGLNSKVKKALDGAAREGRLDSDYKVLREGDSPSAADVPVGAAMFLAPGAIVGVWFFGIRKLGASKSGMRGSGEAPAVPSSPPTPPPLPPVPPSRS